MNGLDKILEQISLEANKNSENIIKKAEADAEKIKNQARLDSEKQAEELLKASKSECEELIERSKSSAQLFIRQNTLKTKQKIISDIIEDAHNYLLNLDDDKYFALILKMAEKNCQNQKGEILFNSTDLKRMPSTFKNELLKVSNNNLSISDMPIDIDGGFVLSYGGIEENCSFDAIFGSNEEILQDKAHSLLFE